MGRATAIVLGVAIVLIAGLVGWWLIPSQGVSSVRMVDVRPNVAPPPDDAQPLPPPEGRPATAGSGTAAPGAGQRALPRTSRDRALQRLEALAADRRADTSASTATSSADAGSAGGTAGATLTTRQKALARLEGLAATRSGAPSTAPESRQPAASAAAPSALPPAPESTREAVPPPRSPPSDSGLAAARQRAADRLNALAAATTAPTTPAAGVVTPTPRVDDRTDVTARPGNTSASVATPAPGIAATSTAPTPATRSESLSTPASATAATDPVAALPAAPAPNIPALAETPVPARRTTEPATQVPTTPTAPLMTARDRALARLAELAGGSRALPAPPVAPAAGPIETPSPETSGDGDASALSGATTDVLERTDPILLAEAVASVEPDRIASLPETTRDRLDQALANAARAAAAAAPGATPPGAAQTGTTQSAITRSGAPDPDRASAATPAVPGVTHADSKVLAEVVAALPAEALVGPDAPNAAKVERALEVARADATLDEEASAFIKALSTPSTAVIPASEADHFVTYEPAAPTAHAGAPTVTPPTVQAPPGPASTARPPATEVTRADDAPAPPRPSPRRTAPGVPAQTVVVREIALDDLALGAPTELPPAMELVTAVAEQPATVALEPLRPHQPSIGAALEPPAPASMALDLAAVGALGGAGQPVPGVSGQALRNLTKRELRADDPLIAELLRSAGATRPGALYYVRTVRPGDVQGIWGIIQSGLIDNFARGMAVRRGESLERYRVRIPRHADEPLSNSQSSFLGRLIHAKTRATTVYNLAEGRLEKDPDFIKPGQQIVIVDFTPEELTAIYRHFAGARRP